MVNKNIFKIVLTGGPCAGKTTVFNKLIDYLVNKGYYVITNPETATELIKNKIIPSGSKAQVMLFQDLVLKKQYNKECVSETYAKNLNFNDKPIIILYDRAIMDNRAYLESDEDFEYILKNNNLNGFEMLNKYDLVIDLISTASLMPEKYELDNVRFETVEEAKKIDEKTTMAWLGHSNMKIITPKGSIDDKCDTVIKLVDNYINGYSFNKKQIKRLESFYDLPDYNDNNSKKIIVSNIYLKNDIIIQKRQLRDNYIYILINSNSNHNVLLSYEQAFSIINSNDILYNERQEEIYFIYDSIVYKVVIDKDKIYLEYDENLSMPNIYDSKDSVFIKKRKYDSI